MEPEVKQIKNVHTRIYAQACEALHIPYRLGLRTRGLFVTKKDGSEAFIYKAITPINKHSSAKLSAHKTDTIAQLKEHHVAVPTSTTVKTQEELMEFWKLHKAIVVKPLDAHGGIGITVLPKEQELGTAFELAKRHSKSVIAETYISGNNYRFLVLDGRVLAVALRLPPFIIGNGQDTVLTLIEDKNVENKTNKIPQIKINSITEMALRSQGFSYESIPPVGTKVLARYTANLSLGGTVEDVSSKCLEEYKNVAIQAAKAIDLRITGVDLIAEDVTKPGLSASVIEVNASPGMRIHRGSSEIAKEIIRAIVA